MRDRVEWEAMEKTKIVAQLAPYCGPDASDTVVIEPRSGVPVYDASGRVIGYAEVDGDGRVTADVDEEAALYGVGAGTVSIGGKVKR